MSEPLFDNVCTQIPTYEWCIENNYPPVAVIDVVVNTFDGIHSIPKYGFEVVYTHECDTKKIKQLKNVARNTNFEIYEISAEWILRQSEIPKEFEFLKKII